MFKQINAFSKNISSSVLKSYSHISGSTSTPNLFSTSISTASSVSSSATEPDASPPTSVSQETIELWIADTQRGIDALFDDNFIAAEDIFLQHLNESPFHAVGYALMGYIEAMLGFEPEKIQIATERLAHAEHLAHSFAKNASKESWLSHLKLSLRNGKDMGEKDVPSSSPTAPTSHPASPIHSASKLVSALPISMPSFPAPSSSIVQNKSKNTLGLEYELLEANCILMSATIQFLRESWIDYMKAAYKLRKSYKMFDSMFSAVTGKSASEYAAELKRERKRNPLPRQQYRQSNTSSHYSSGSSSSGVSFPGSRPVSVLQTPKTNNLSRKDSIQQTLDRLTSLSSNGSSPAPSPSTSSLSQNDLSNLTKQENIQQTLDILTASAESTIIYPHILAATQLHPFTTEPFDNPGSSPSSSLASSPLTSFPPSSPPSSPILSTQLHSGSYFVPNPDDDFPFDTAQPTFPFKKTSKTSGRHSMWSVSGVPLASAGANDHRRKTSKQGKRRSMPVFSSTSNTATSLYPPPPDPGTPSGLIEEGVMFGVGLFSLIFSLLPPRINKILNTLGFNSYRPFALHLLHRSYDSSGIYSSLSALSLLAYYTSFALFGHYALLPSSLRLADAHDILEDMKKKYPKGKIWRLMEGKLNKMEGNNRRGVEVLRDARRTIRRDGLGASGNGNGFTGTSGANGSGKRDKAFGELAQLQALAVYEMGWGQIFLGDYFQASETFFRLESMNNWSRAFYHYIATCCMFADEEYGKAALEYLQIPAILHRRRFNTRLMPNEAFADRKIRSWCEKAILLDGPSSKHGKHGLYNEDDETGRRRESLDSISTKASSTSILNGDRLKQVVVVNPLWELVYLWNGIPQLGVEMLRTMCKSLEKSIEAHTPLSRKGSISVSMASSISTSSDSSISALPSPLPAVPSLCSTSEFALLHLLYGTTVRELGDHVRAERSFRTVLELEARMIEDRWVVPYTLYEMAVLCCIIAGMGGEAVALTTPLPIGTKRDKIKEAKEWLKKAANWNNRESMATDQESNGNGKHGNGNVGPTASIGDYDFDGRLHIRCQLLEERLAEEV